MNSIRRPSTQTTRKSHVVEHCRRTEYLFEEKLAATFLVDPTLSLDSVPFWNGMLAMLEVVTPVDAHGLLGRKCMWGVMLKTATWGLRLSLIVFLWKYSNFLGFADITRPEESTEILQPL